ncbi:MAG: serine/threonine protein kinase [Planctomycetes bacterium]|nr:serine/threonine protein kinase [Planctomycetota bacterium]
MSDPRTTTRRDGPDLPLRQAGPYQLLAIVGHGRGGTVFLARRPGIERNFALKLLPPGLDPEAEARALREARLASRLAHPGFARVLEIDRHQDRLYVVMEHVPGPTLRELVERGGPMASPEAAELVAELAESLEAAHRAGVLHRDVSPQNVVLDDRTGRPRLVDFGLACEDGDGGRLTRPGEGLGTPDAAAPELLRGDPVDARADVYGLGVVLYELLAGARPFEGPAADVVRAVLSPDPADRPPPPSARAPGVDRQVEAACLRAMAPSPEDRFASAGDLARALAAPRAPAARPGGRWPLAAVRPWRSWSPAAAAWLDARAEPPQAGGRRAATSASTPPAPPAPGRGRGGRRRAAAWPTSTRRAALARARDDARAALAVDNVRAQLPRPRLGRAGDLGRGVDARPAGSGPPGARPPSAPATSTAAAPPRASRPRARRATPRSRPAPSRSSTAATRPARSSPRSCATPRPATPPGASRSSSRVIPPP